MRYVAILGIPPISTAVDAVRAYNAAQTQDRFKAARKLTSKENDGTRIPRAIGGRGYQTPRSVNLPKLRRAATLPYSSIESRKARH